MPYVNLGQTDQYPVTYPRWMESLDDLVINTTQQCAKTLALS